MEVVVKTIISAKPWGIIASAKLSENGPSGAAGELIRLTARTDDLVGVPVEGETWIFDGRLVDHPIHGRQFEVSSGSRRKPQGRLICDFLVANVPGMGITRAGRLWDAFGHDLPDVLATRDLTRIGEAIVPARPCLGVRVAADAVAAWGKLESEVELILWLDRHGLGDPATVGTLRDVLPRDAVACLQENPYRLVALLPWRTVDAIGLKVLEDGGHASPKDHPHRLVGAVDAAIKHVIATGDTWVGRRALRDGIARVLAVPPSYAGLDTAISLGEANGAITPHLDGYRAPGCAVMEEMVAGGLEAMMDRKAAPEGLGTPDDVRRLVAEAQDEQAPLHPEQAAAAIKVLGLPLACLQGGAGVGKTHTLRVICDAWEAGGGDLLLCALAGKAALRLSQATGRLARTITRTLMELDGGNGPEGGGDGTWARMTPRTLVVVDEASMVDLASAYRLLDRMLPGARLLLVGDERQLPPIGFGVVYHRLVADDRITARLTTVRRQADESGIPGTAATIRRREMPLLERYTGPRSGVHLMEAEDREAIAGAVLRIASDFDERPMIVTPTRVGAAGMMELNARFHEEAAVLEEVRCHAGQRIGPGEPVIHLRNDYRRNLYNGSLGVVASVDVEAGTAVVTFDDKPVSFSRQQLSDVAQAYAITCHRAQGSQARRVVVALYDSRVLDPSWVYTAITRAEEQVVVVGDADTLSQVLQRPWAAELRKVALPWPRGNAVHAGDQ